jgi:hypothetical protein
VKAAIALRRFGRPALLHALGLVAVAIILWLAWRGYRQPELLIDFANSRMC